MHSDHFRMVRGDSVAVFHSELTGQGLLICQAGSVLPTPEIAAQVTCMRSRSDQQFSFTDSTIASVAICLRIAVLAY